MAVRDATTTWRAPRVVVAVLGACAAALLLAAASFAVGDEGASVRQTLLRVLVVVAPGAASALCFARAQSADRERAGWMMTGFALFASATGNAAAGAASIDASVTAPPLAIALWALCYALALRGFSLLVRARLGRLDLTTRLDGLLGALVAGMLLVWGLLELSDARIGMGDAVVVVVPFLDVLLLGLFLGAAAQGGWRFGGWTPFILGTGALAVYDCAFAAEALGSPPAFVEAGHLFLPAAYLLFAYGCWAKPVAPKPYPAARGLVPVVLGGLAVVALGVAALAPAQVPDASAVFALAAIVAGLGRFAATITENDRLTSGAQAQALTDALTGLANRRQLESDLAHSLREATPAQPHALAILDLDGFKRYNDTFGHQAGDDLLKAASERLRAAVDGCGTAYRLGGDEFCVLVWAQRSAQDAQNVIDAASAALSSSRTGFSVQASHGVVLLPEQASTADAALRIADQRMYGHKASRAASQDTAAAHA